ncbi:hypothetical protein [Absidia glauca]|uniref:DNA recombination and repair protein Rad51-like C-terminal domain-containing protein n=1 Tax=Absidia glauca TaxID=4829 RepID=A0A168LRA8_ABSGL|nr:hypothetical protein [Absidia glauca]
MPKLTFLKHKWTSEQQQLFEAAIDTLETCGIVDDLSFLLVDDLAALSTTTKVPSPILAALRQQLVSNSRCVDSQAMQGEPRYIRTPFQLLNTCLSGGFRLDDVVEASSDNAYLLGKFFTKLVEGFLAHHPQGKVIHIDTTGRFQSRLIMHSKMPLSQIECNKALTIAAINQTLERYGALRVASRRRQPDDQQATLIVIEDIGCLLDSTWETVVDQVKRLHQIVLLLKSMGICIVVSHCIIPTQQRRNDYNWDLLLDLRLALYSSGGEPMANILKARHVVENSSTLLFGCLIPGTFIASKIMLIDNLTSNSGCLLTILSDMHIEDLSPGTEDRGVVDYILDYSI